MLQAIVASNTLKVTAEWRSTVDSVLPYMLTIQSKALSIVRYSQPWDSCRFRRWAHIEGVAVSETNNETAMATESVTANSRNRRPTTPPINKRGVNTPIRETLMVITVKPISFAPLSAAWNGSMPFSR